MQLHNGQPGDVLMRGWVQLALSSLLDDIKRGIVSRLTDSNKAVAMWVQLQWRMRGSVHDGAAPLAAAPSSSDTERLLGTPEAEEAITEAAVSAKFSTLRDVVQALERWLPEPRLIQGEARHMRELAALPLNSVLSIAGAEWW